MRDFRRCVYLNVWKENANLGTQIGEAYQVLSNEELRKRYDKFGKEESVPGGGFGEWLICIQLSDHTDRR
jgi:DnaJ-class molecular chaperone